MRRKQVEKSLTVFTSPTIAMQFYSHLFWLALSWKTWYIVNKYAWTDTDAYEHLFYTLYVSGLT